MCQNGDIVTREPQPEKPAHSWIDFDPGNGAPPPTYSERVSSPDRILDHASKNLLNPTDRALRAQQFFHAYKDEFIDDCDKLYPKKTDREMVDAWATWEQ